MNIVLSKQHIEYLIYFTVVLFIFYILLILYFIYLCFKNRNLDSRFTYLM
jgi:hypothetical protein